MSKISVVVPNWNGVDGLRRCLNSLMAQSLQAHVIVVDNGSVDNSVELIEKFYPTVEIIRHTKNKGYAGGVNPGFRRAIETGCDYVVPFNNDAVADKAWLEKLANHLDKHQKTGIATCKMVSVNNNLDSTGEFYTIWGLPFPRGRGEADINKYDKQTEIFAASGGASLYRVKMLKEIGLLDEDFFAYYEDVDLSFRAQLAGWKIAYVPESIVYHEISATGSKIKGFFTYQTMKNLPMLFTKDVPLRFWPTILPRFAFVYLTFFASAGQRGQLGYAFKGAFRALLFSPKKLTERHRIQKHRKVPDAYIWNMLEHDLPPNADKLRRLRAVWWRFAKKSHS